MTEAILILTEDEALLDDLLRLCAAVGAQPEVLHGASVPTGQWERARLVLLGDDRAVSWQNAGPWPHARRPGVLLVGRDLDDHTVWARGVAAGAEEVLHLPDSEPWLADRIADVVESADHPALTLGVLGGRGGAGASTLACGLALAAARTGHATTLIDADPLGGGLDVLLGGESTPGLRWPGLTSSRGRLSGAALTESLPRLHGLSVLSWDRAGPVRLPADAMRSVLATARRRGGVVVLDLPRAVDDATAEALAQLDLGLLLVPAEVRAVAAARRVIGTAGSRVRDLRVVARTPGAGDLSGSELGELLGLSLAGELAEEPGLADAVEAGKPPGGDRKGPLAHFSAALLERILPMAEAGK